MKMRTVLGRLREAEATSSAIGIGERHNDGVKIIINTIKARSMLVGGERRTFSSLLLKSQVLAGYCYFLAQRHRPKGNVYRRNRVRKPLRNDEDFLHIRVLHFAPRSVTGPGHVLARIIWAINVAGLSWDSP